MKTPLIALAAGLMLGTAAPALAQQDSAPTAATSTGSEKVNLVIVVSMYRALCSPGLMPGINAPDFFKLSAVSLGLKTSAV